MQLTVSTDDERVVMVDVDVDESVENVKAIVAVETDIPVDMQRLLHNGRELANADRLSAHGVSAGDLLFVVRGAPPNGDPPTTARTGVRSPLDLAEDGSAVDPQAFLAALRSSPTQMSLLRQNNPTLHDCIVANDASRLQQLLRRVHQQRMDINREEMELLSADPFDVDAQRRIEERIMQENVEENLQTAMEYTPEAFGSVVMLYVDMEVNGHPLKAFVDSGAQSTIMSQRCAEQCGIMRLVDRRFAGVAVGVGTSKIVGRVHIVQIKVGSVFLPCSVTVLEDDKMDFLFGLDMLKKHQCTIDLKNNVLTFGGGDVSLPFLAEKDIPERKRFLDMADEAREAAQDGATASDAGDKAQAPAGVEAKTQAAAAAAAAALAAAAAGAVPPRAAAGAAQSSSSTPAAPGSGQPLAPEEAKIGKLMALGFPRDLVLQALTLCGGNEDQAASYLFEMS